LQASPLHPAARHQHTGHGAARQGDPHLALDGRVDRRIAAGEEVRVVRCRFAGEKHHHLSPDIDIRIAANNEMLDLEREGIEVAVRYCTPKDAPRDATKLFGEVVLPVCSPRSVTNAAPLARAAVT